MILGDGITCKDTFYGYSGENFDGLVQRYNRCGAVLGA